MQKDKFLKPENKEENLPIKNFIIEKLKEGKTPTDKEFEPFETDLKTCKEILEAVKKNRDYLRRFDNPVDFYNRYCLNDVLMLIDVKIGERKTLLRDDTEIYDNKELCFELKDDKWYSYDTRYSPLPTGQSFSNFELITELSFKGSYKAALNYVEHKFFNRKIPFIRVATDYFKIVPKPDRFGIVRVELKKWKKETINDDYWRGFAEKNVPAYDDFLIEPDNVNYNPVINSDNSLFYNVYYKFSHTPKEGKWPWSEVIMRHIFGEQYELGLKYMQVLYLYPKKILPVLVLASKIRGTGKTTFLDWLNILFGANMVLINPEDLTGSFNSIYARSNIIAIEETLYEKQTSIEKLKALTTGKFIAVNEKFVTNYKLPFFGKVILSTNNEENFARIDDEEIRFWIRKINPIPDDNANHAILDNLIEEIPAFLHYLQSMPEPDFTRSRMVFTPEEIDTESLRVVKDYSHSRCFKDIWTGIREFLQEKEMQSVCFNTSDLKDKLFLHDKYQRSYLLDVLKDEFKLEPKNGRFKPFTELTEKRTDYFEITRQDVGLEPYNNNNINELPF